MKYVIFVLLALGLLLVAGRIGQAVSNTQEMIPVSAVSVPAKPSPQLPSQNLTQNETVINVSANASVNASSQASGTAQSEPGSVVRIAVSEISTALKNYSYDVNGTRVKFFAVLGSDGKVRTAFDACQVCYKAKKGYSQAGNDVRCNNCGRQFAIDGLGTSNLVFGCWPVHLPNEADGDVIVIKVSDLEAGMYLFS